jgi:hypothetical protein
MENPGKIFTSKEERIIFADLCRDHAATDQTNRDEQNEAFDGF